MPGITCEGDATICKILRDREKRNLPFDDRYRAPYWDP
jgi:hypothetical protein